MHGSGVLRMCGRDWAGRWRGWGAVTGVPCGYRPVRPNREPSLSRLTAGGTRFVSGRCEPTDL